MVRLITIGPPIAVGLIAFALVARGLQPGLAFWDTAELQVVAPLMGTAHPTGFPTYVLLGWLASVLLQPFGEPAFRMNLFSAICVAVAAGVTMDLVRVLTRSRWIGAVAGLGLVLTPQVWVIGTHAEAHSLHLALLAILLRLLVGWEDRRRAPPDDARPVGAARERADRWLVAATVVFALAVGNHSLTLLLAPAIAAYVIAVEPGIVRRVRLVATCLGALAVTLLVVYLELPLRAGPFRAPLVYGQPDTWDGFRYIVLAEQFRGSVDSPFANLDTKFVDLVGRTASEFALLALLVPFGFIAAAVRRPRYALLTGIALGLTVFFAASYDNAAIERYYLGPILICWTWLAILVAAAVDTLARALRRVGDWYPSVRPIVVSVLAIGILLGPALIDFTHRARAADRSHDTIAQRWLDRVVDVLEPNAVVVSWWSYSTPLWYGKHIEGRLPGVDIIDDRTRLDEDLGSPTDVVNRYLGERPVYVIRLDDWQDLEEEFVIERVPMPMPDSLWRVVGRRGDAS
jgi:Protein O-mannosyl-transferase TMEM260-like